MIRAIKSGMKAGLRAAVRWRMRYLPLSEKSAETWTQRIKQWPALFDDTLATRVVALDHQVQMQVGIVDHIERQLWFHREWDRPVKVVLESLLAPGDTYIDLGANIGYFTLLASRLVGPGGTVVAIEPSVRALRKLTSHLWLNRCENVLLISCAAGNHWSRGELGLATESNIGGSAIVVNRQHPTVTEAVWLAPLDDLVQGLSLKPKLIKLDLEGFEFAALNGAQQLISQSLPWIVCEVTEKLLRKFDSSTEQLFSLLQELGYHPFRLSLNSAHPAWESVDWQMCAAVEQQDVVFVPPNGDLAAVKLA